MEIDQDLDFSHRETLQRVFEGGAPLACERLSGGVSCRATRWDVQLADGALRRVVLRSPNDGDHARAVSSARVEAQILTLLRDTAVRAPRLMALDLTVPTLVLEYVEGEPCFEQPLSPMQVDQLVQQLVAIHRLTPERETWALLPERSESARRLSGGEFAAAEDLSLVREIQRALGERPVPRGRPEVLLHGDYWPGNVLWRGQEIAAVLDWEQAERGDPMADLAVARLDLLWGFGWEAVHAFTQGYLDATGDEDCTLPWWDLLACLRSAGQLAHWAGVYAPPPLSRPDITAVTMTRDWTSFARRALHELGRRYDHAPTDARGE